MTDFPNIQVVSPPSIHTFSKGSHIAVARMYDTFGISAEAWTANLATFIPMDIEEPYPVERWVYHTGVQAGNASMGIYDRDSGKRLFTTGAIAWPGTFTMTYSSSGCPFVIPEGRYYFAFSGDTTNGSFVVGAAGADQEINRQRLVGIKQQASAHPLPADMSGAGNPTLATVPLFGVTKRSSGIA